MSRPARAIGYALTWASLVTVAEWLARRSLPSRSSAWLVAYSVLGAGALITGARVRRRSGGLSLAGLTLAAIGYPLGRRLLGDRPSMPPPDGPVIELVAINVVAATEEVTWGAVVEPVLGPTATAALFATKHIVIDGRWRRGLGLFAFWMGLASLRRRWPVAALVGHCVLNSLGVAQGHFRGRDQF